MKSYIAFSAMNLYSLICVVTLLFGAPAASALEALGCNHKRCDNNPRHLEAFSASFYRWYIDNAFIHDSTLLDGAFRKKISKLITRKLARELNHKMADPDWDSDPVTYSQDYNDTWLFPIAHVVHSHPNLDASLKVTFTQPPLAPYELCVFLKVERGHWLIDRIQGEE